MNSPFKCFFSLFFYLLEISEWKICLVDLNKRFKKMVPLTCTLTCIKWTLHKVKMLGHPALCYKAAFSPTYVRQTPPLTLKNNRFPQKLACKERSSEGWGRVEMVFLRNIYPLNDWKKCKTSGFSSSNCPIQKSGGLN